MMKLFYNLQRGVGLLVFCTILLSACVNHISEEEEDSVNNGDIPLKFIADIRESVGTRMANNNFAEGDEVGLFALAGTTTMQEERYVDNLHFIRSSNGEFESNESVYYPDDGVIIEFNQLLSLSKEWRGDEGRAPCRWRFQRLKIFLTIIHILIS